MIKYTEFSVQDFAKDDAFINWCLEPNANTNAFWNDLIHQYPEIESKILEARILVTDLQILEMEKFTEDFESEIWNNIEENLTDTPIVNIPVKNVAAKPNRKSSIIRNISPLVAACFVLIIVSSVGYLTISNTVDGTPESEWQTFTNNSGTKKTIILQDSSQVVLEPFTSLKYPSEFVGNERVVLLQGEAFFDIRRDTLKPFLVYANETITKVLGTSFFVSAYEGETNVEVEVVTGKVAVYANVASKNKKKKTTQDIAIKTDKVEYFTKPNKKLEIIPNQKVVFDSKALNMTRQISKLPKLVKKIESLSQFNFNNEPVTQLFLSLEEAYGIDLNFDSKLLKGCKITTQLSKEPLFEKLNIVCTALDLTYEQKDGKIFIYGEGCS